MAILLLHGLGSSSRGPLALVRPVLPARERVLAPDVRAHGASPLLGDAANFTLESLAGEIAAGLPREPLTIIGVSMGAAIGLRLALLADIEVRALVFLRPAFTTQPEPANLAAFPVMGELLATVGAERGELLFRESPYFRDLERESPLGAAGAIDQFRQSDAAARAIRLIEIPRNTAFTSAADLAGIAAPASVVAAPRDPVHPVEVAELWAQSLPNARLTVVPARDDGLPAYTAALRAAVRAALPGEN